MSNSRGGMIVVIEIVRKLNWLNCIVMYLTRRQRRQKPLHRSLQYNFK